MKKLFAVFAVVLLTLTQGGSVAAYSYSGSRSYSAPRSYSTPKTYSAPKSSTPKSSTPKSSTPKSTPKSTTPKTTTQKGKWNSSKTYGAKNGTKVGKAPLVSKTPKPEPHSFNNRKFYSSDSIYTNTSGQWVTYFILGALVGNALTDDQKKEVHCFDKDHKEITCNRDDNSYQKDW